MSGANLQACFPFCLDFQKGNSLSERGGSVPKNTKMATKFGVIVFNGKLVNLSFEKLKYNALFMKTVSAKITMRTMKHLMFFSLISITRGI